MGSDLFSEGTDRTDRHRRKESLDAEVQVRLSKVRGGATLFEEVGRVAGLEVHGELDRLISMTKGR